jgi:hypothetical protein
MDVHGRAAVRERAQEIHLAGIHHAHHLGIGFTFLRACFFFIGLSFSSSSPHSRQIRPAG